ncbi:PREDICTED: myeloid differentiation primary response protein MyD88-like isoform X2 [Acropora digitifera]|uniref:myeloid differentiation primary response protein MyD88-like isoform X2 n=1 Tax=Acropora digitifera TaxID=70779 RepID=UPI00077A658A|nr:PREDICTED: myeloid differentiation primary response protein MyD88-like isoform X2 [Acropora digitifera]
MESSRRKRFTTRIKESLKRTPKNEGRKMPKQNLPEFPVQSQNPELTRVDLTSVEETSPRDTQAREEVEMVTSNEKLMKHLPPEGKKTLVELLQPLNQFGKDYRGLADSLGFNRQFIDWLGSTNEPVVRLLTHIESIKITEVISHLEKMGRQDAAEDLHQFEELTHSPGELEEHRRRIGDTEDRPTTHKRYDAFVCFAAQDKQFLKKLVTTMEAQPYNLRLCYTERDFLGGGCYLENAALVIEQMCKKFVVLLSKNYDGSDGAVYESQIAITLEPGAQQQRIIPILLEDEYRKTIPKPMAHLTYLDYPRWQENIPKFWEKLAVSLGWNQSQTSCRTVLPSSNLCIRCTPSRRPSKFIFGVRFRFGKKKKKEIMLKRT